MIRKIAVHGRWARVYDSGSEPGSSKPILLLIHGITRSLNDWDPQIAALTDEFRIIAPDLPGYGWSAPHPDGPGLAALAQGAGEVLDALNVTEPVHVVGNSLGGAVAMTFLTQRPDQVASLALVDPAGFGKEVTPLLKMLGLPLIGRLIATTPSYLSAVIAERALFVNKSFATRARIRHALTILRETDAGSTAYYTGHELGTVLGGVAAGWRNALLNEIAATPRPTLVVWGDHDTFLPPHHLQAAKQALPHAETRLFTGVGHMPQLEIASEFNTVLSDFVLRARHGAKLAG